MGAEQSTGANPEPLDTSPTGGGSASADYPPNLPAVDPTQPCKEAGGEVLALVAPASVGSGLFVHVPCFGELFDRKSEPLCEADSMDDGGTAAAVDDSANEGKSASKSSIWEATLPARSARGLPTDAVRESSDEATRRAQNPYLIFKRHKPFEIGPKQSLSPPLSARIGISSSTYARAVAAGAYSLAMDEMDAVAKRLEEMATSPSRTRSPSQSPGRRQDQDGSPCDGHCDGEEEEDIEKLAEIARSMRERTEPVSSWDEPVRLHTKTLSAALGIDWTKYLSRIDTQRAAAAAMNADERGRKSPPSSERGSASARGGSSSRSAIYTRDGRRIDMSLRSEQEAQLIERVQGHSTTAVPSASHPSVAKYVGADGTPGITPRSTTITPRSMSHTPRANGATPRSSSAPRSNGLNRSTPRHSASPRRPLPQASIGLEHPPSVPPEVPGYHAGVHDAKPMSAHAASSSCGGGGRSGSGSMAEREAQRQVKLEAGLAAVREKRQAMSRPLRQALSSKIDSAATLINGTGMDTQTYFESDGWRDSNYWKTHIDYRTLKHRGRGSHSLHDLRASTISIPLQNPDNAGKGTTSSVAVGQGSNGGSAAAMSRTLPVSAICGVAMLPACRGQPPFCLGFSAVAASAASRKRGHPNSRHARGTVG